MAKSIIQEKSYAFALRIVKLYKYLLNQNEYILCKQVVKSGTSIGANVEEALVGQSKRDFIAKLSIARKEARETHYWLRLLRDSNFIEGEAAESMIEDVEELSRILTSIILTSQKDV